MGTLRRILVWLFLLVGLAAAAGILWQRARWDSACRGVMLAFDATAFTQLAQAGVSVTLPSPSAVAVSEATLLSLRQLGFLSPVLRGERGGNAYRFVIPCRLVFDFGGGEADLLESRIRRCLSWQLAGGYEVGVEVLPVGNAEPAYLGVLTLPPLTLEQENLLTLGFYLWPEFPLPEEYALVFRPNGTGLLNREAIAEKYSWIPRHPRTSPLVIFSGNRVPGYPSLIDQAAQLLSRPLGLVEFSQQDGDKALAARLKPEQVFWVHSIAPEEIPGLAPEAMVQRFLRALRERNPRVLYLHPVTASGWLEPRPDLLAAAEAANNEYLAALKSGIDQEGFELSLQMSSPAHDPPLSLRAPAMLLAFLAAVWLVLVFFPGGRLALFITHPATMLAALLLSFPLAASGSVRALAALWAALVYPLLGLGFAVKYYGEHPARRARRTWPLLPALIAFGIAFLLSLLGGLTVHSLLTSTAAFAKLEVFHGVLLSRSLPVLLALAYFYNLSTLSWAPASRNLYVRLNRLLAYPVNYLDLALLLILVASVGYALLRAGNEFGFLVTGTETSVRGSLEQLFGVRPRTTELVGHFALIWFFVLLPWSHRSLLLPLAAGVMGLCSVVNTHTHLHTPLLVSLQRTLTGLLLPLLAAALSYGAAWLAIKLYWRLQAARRPREG